MGTCRQCKRKRTTYPASRFGGGNYRRAGRWYQSQICGECATRLAARHTPGHMTVDRWGITGLRRVAEALEGDGVS